MELTFDKLSKKFDDLSKVNEISITLKPGIYGLLRANGAGKTTLMRMTCGILKPTSGSILLNGNSTIELGEEYRNILGYLPQHFGYYNDFTAEEFLRYIACIKGINIKVAKTKTNEILDTVSLYNVRKKKIKTFSGGMKQRLGIAQAVLNDPKILVLDEPTAGLDPKERVRFRNLISHIAKNKIVIVSTHIVSDVDYIADTILIMKNGKLLLHSPTKEIIKTINNKVWVCKVTEKDIVEFSDKYTVVNLHDKGSYVELRIINETSPNKDAISVNLTLEDLYLYYFSDTLEESEGEIR